MSTQQELDRLIEVAEQLDPRAVSAEVSLLTGARLKSANLEGGSRSSDIPLPLPDSLDRKITRQSKNYRRFIADARDLLERAHIIQKELLVRLHDEHGRPTEEAQKLAAEAVSPQADLCSNCGRVVERTANDKLLAGRCRPCHDYKKRTGLERPQHLWTNAA